MRLSARPLLNYVNVNNFSYGNQWIIRAGDPNTLYFQLVDLDQAVANTRYMAGVGVGNTPVGVTVTFPSIDDTQVIVAQAIQETDDKSIWKVVLGPNQKPNTGNVQFAVSEGNSIRRFSALQLLAVEYPQNEGSC